MAPRLPDLVQPWARVSDRLLEELKALGLAASAQVNERLAPRLGMNVKAPTLLRYLRAIPPPADMSVRVLGIDDFAMKRGGCYGTILVDLETHRPIELLPDRTADAVLPWLRNHPKIEVVSPDRASSYADAVKRALPHATEVADRYHLVQNLREHLQQFLDRKHTCLPEIEDSPLKAVSTNDRDLASALETQTSVRTSRPSPSTESASSTEQPEAQGQPELPNGQMGQEMELTCLTYAERKKKISRDKRSARYEQVLALHQAGMGQRAIGRSMHMSRRILRRFLTSQTFPERAAGSGRRPKSKRKLAPYLAYLRERWNAGEHTGSHLCA